MSRGQQPLGIAQKLSRFFPSALLGRALRSTNPYIAVPAVAFVVLRWLRRNVGKKSSKAQTLRIRPGDAFVVEGKVRGDTKVSK